MPGFDTASLRAPTGLDDGARMLILQVGNNEAGLEPGHYINALFKDRFGSPEDYFAGVESVHGWEARQRCQSAVQAVYDEHQFQLSYERDGQAQARALLLAMPEPDFMTAIEEIALKVRQNREIAERLTTICAARGVPYKCSVSGGFEWIGDAEVQRELIAPALAAIHDKRFAGGVRSEFKQARSELREGTPASRKQAIHEAGCAVESAMKVVLTEHKIGYKPADTGKALFDLLERAGLVARYMEPTFFAVLTPRNKAGGHGGGVQPHEPGEAEASTVVASAAGAIAYLYQKLP